MALGPRAGQALRRLRSAASVTAAMEVLFPGSSLLDPAVVVEVLMRAQT